MAPALVVYLDVNCKELSFPLPEGAFCSWKQDVTSKDHKSDLLLDRNKEESHEQEMQSHPNDSHMRQAELCRRPA
jgi:hypothetical protein